MLAPRHHLKVFWAVVVAFPVLVVNDFRASERSAKDDRHDHPVFFDGGSTELEDDVPLGVFVSASRSVGRLVKLEWITVTLPAAVVFLAPAALLGGSVTQGAWFHSVVNVPANLVADKAPA